MPEEPTPARQVVEAEIRTKGPITFARFMEIALYGEHGYYSGSLKARADYATSSQIHPAFGALIAGWLFKAWEAIGEPDEFDIVELGAGDGGLAIDILDAVESGQGSGGRVYRFGKALRYHAFDLQPRGSVRGVDELSTLGSIVGCVISNELLDAFPAHIFTVRGSEVLESFVGIDGSGNLTFVESDVSSDEIVDRVGGIASMLPDGYRGEVNLGIADWTARVRSILKRGYVLTIDYGHEREMLYHPARIEGSLRCYRDHVLGQNPFRHVGLQDMTTHVDFTAVREELRGVGLRELSPLLKQRDFLFGLGIGDYIRQVRQELVKSVAEIEVHRLTSELRGLNSLVDSRGLGDFRVSQFGVNAPSIAISDLESAPVYRLPLSAPRHLSYFSYD